MFPENNILTTCLNMPFLQKNKHGKAPDKTMFLKILLSQLSPTDGVVRKNRALSYAYVPVIQMSSYSYKRR